MPYQPPVFRPPSFKSGFIDPATKQKERAYDQRRGGARQRLYDNKWDKARRTFLSHRRDCAMVINGRACGAPSTIVDHIVPHRGDQARFWDQDNWQPLCKPCHDSRKQSQERLGYDAQRRNLPFDVRLSRIPVMMVCGAAGSGKSTYVQKEAWPTDLIIDLDVIRAKLAGTEIHHPSPEWTSRALDERNNILRSLAHDNDHTRAWFIIAAPQRSVRDAWAHKLGAIEVVVLETPLEECIRRIRHDPRRFGQYERMESLARAWWDRFTP